VCAAVVDGASEQDKPSAGQNQSCTR
jgi:hypothetical protein